MGPPGRYRFPKDIYAPTGQFWANPRNWRRNTALSIAGMAVAYLWLIKVGMDHEVLARPPRKKVPWRPNLKPVPYGEDPWAPENQRNYEGGQMDDAKSPE
ncbi:hypothetical protein NDN08_004229 [Rhodosorus marinus]|uniref:Uncharacterized protein n=1 Tax=Rhodosorus marinus TaxID=101924 RepID=A0AAV8UHP5_9RHOD|nr:hypothetical protein NDN08_004229 [Rhodosorus marinus]